MIARPGSDSNAIALRACSRQMSKRSSTSGSGGTTLPSSAARLGEDPRVTVRPAGDHDRSAAGLVPHAARVRSGRDVTVPDDRNLQSLDQIADLGPPGLARVHVRSRPRVKANGLGTRLLAAQSDGHRVAGLFVEAAADLHRRGQGRRIVHRPNDQIHKIEIA